MGPIGSPATSVTDYQSMLHNIPEHPFHLAFTIGLMLLVAWFNLHTVALLEFLRFQEQNLYSCCAAKMLL